MSRLYGDKAELSYVKIEEFFRKRSEKLLETGPLSVTMYQTEEIARIRDLHEKDKVTPLLNANRSTRVLDIGCGTGRWGVHLAKSVKSYLGLDFCSAYIEAGRNIFASLLLDDNHFTFQEMKATVIDATQLTLPPPFDLVIIAGVLAFLNDKDASVLISKAYALLSPGGIIYIREPLANETRLTLLEHPSEQLQQEYSAIYRSKVEMNELMRPIFGKGGTLLSQFQLYPPHMLAAETRGETNQWVYVIRARSE